MTNPLSEPTIHDLIRKAGYLPEEDLESLRQAYEFAARIHKGKFRLSGAPYISHPLAISYTLAAMKLDVTSLVAGLLHSVLKDQAVIPSDRAGTATEQELRNLFGEDVAGIVSGATKIAQVQFNNKTAYQAENVRKMLLAMSSDIRVLLVKLADRLHDMQTLEYLARQRQQEISIETMDLYAPLASRLGIDWMKRELEDLAFAYLYPAEFKELSTKIRSSALDRQAYVDEVKELLYKKLKEFNITDCRILGRPKHLYSIYRKLIAQNIPLEKVYDKVAFRIILKTVRQCYEALGVVHALWSPIDGRFKDFISSPKANMYRSLHTSVVGPYGEFMEVQIRTEEMDKVASEGIAAHWAYKEKKAVTAKDTIQFNWLKKLIHWLQDLKDPKKFLDAVSGELGREAVYVLTPNGEVKGLPQGSTPLDFAYGIHTEIGNHCVGAKVNGKIVPLKYRLKNGDRVEIITSPKQHPNRGWLTMIKTGRAKSRIRQWLRQEEQEKGLKVGREICERELRKHNISLKKIAKDGILKEILKSLSCNTLDDLMRKVGQGKIPVQEIIKRMLPEEPGQLEEPAEISSLPVKPPRKSGAENIITIDGIDDMLVRISHCCMPVPGDDVMGFITAGRGISVHKAGCANLLASDPQRRVEVAWAESIKNVHRAQILIIAQNRKGMAAAIFSAITADDANIVDIDSRASTSNLATMKLVLEVNNRDHLLNILNHVRQVNGVVEARRK